LRSESRNLLDRTGRVIPRSQGNRDVLFLSGLGWYLQATKKLRYMAWANRLDHQAELLSVLRHVDHMELIAQAGTFVTKPASGKKKTIPAGDLVDVFGIA